MDNHVVRNWIAPIITGVIVAAISVYCFNKKDIESSQSVTPQYHQESIINPSSTGVMNKGNSHTKRVEKSKPFEPVKENPIVVTTPATYRTPPQAQEVIPTVPECQTKNVGDLSIYNDNNGMLRLTYWNDPNSYPRQTNRRIEVQPHQSQLLYDLPAGVYHYDYNIYDDNPFHSGNADFRIKACESNQAIHPK